MIDYTSVRLNIETLIADNITGVPVQFENTRIDPTPEIYISVSMTDVNAEPAGCGSNVFMVEGAVIVSILSSIGSGTEESRKIASQISSLLGQLQTDTMTYKSPVLSSVGQIDEKANYFVMNLTIEYTYAYAGEVINC